ncbi:MAG: WYL domain-containing transcriptional regulator [Alkalispirochaeta sp.]
MTPAVGPATLENVSHGDRLSQIEQLLLAHPEGLLRVDIARRLGVHRSTVTRDIAELSVVRPIVEEDDRRVRLDRAGYVTAIHLTMFELEALHLSARLFARVMKFPFPHASAALRKLAEAQGRVSPRLSDWMRETADEIESFPVASAEITTRYRTVIEQLGEAITDGRPVIAHYHSRNHGGVRPYRIYPLTLEPHHEGRAVHLVAWDLSDNPVGFRTFKIERIHALHLEEPDPTFLDNIPLDRIRPRLASAWSIWTSETPAVSVVLRFSSAVADRVLETLWHDTQRIERRSDSSLIWRAEIAEPQEMYPWIRGWGPDVEVIEPKSLRESHCRDFLRGAELYQTAPAHQTDPADQTDV